MKLLYTFEKSYLGEKRKDPSRWIASLQLNSLGIVEIVRKNVSGAKLKFNNPGKLSSR